MDVIQDWAAYLFNTYPDAVQTYSPYLRQVYYITQTARSYLLAIVAQVSSKPDLATIALLLVILFVSLKLFDMLAQMVLFWVRLAVKVLFYGGLIVLALWLYGRGPDGVLEDVEYWFNVWSKEREYYSEKERVARMVNQGKAMPGRGGGGWF